MLEPNRDVPDRAATVADALGDAAERLRRAGAETPRLDAEVLLRHLLGLDRTGFLLRLREPLSSDERRAFGRLVEERASGHPVAYITGEREFMGLPFRVGPGVLVPRPETEILVEWALRRLDADGTVLDVGTGSGVIALSLARHLPPGWPGRIVAADVSAEALAFAAENRRRLDRRHRVRLVRGDLAVWSAGNVRLLLANLPYLRPEQAASPALASEPRLALVGGEDGLALVRRLVDDLPRLVAPGGAVGLEIDPAQREEVVRLVGLALPGASVEVLRDLAGLDRHVVGTLPAEESRISEDEAFEQG